MGEDAQNGGKGTLAGARLSLVPFPESPEKGKRAAIKHMDSCNLRAVSAWYPPFCNLKKRFISKLSTPLPRQTRVAQPSAVLACVCRAQGMAQPCPAACQELLRAVPLLLSLRLLLPRSTAACSSHPTHLSGHSVQRFQSRCWDGPECQVSPQAQLLLWP